MLTVAIGLAGYNWIQAKSSVEQDRQRLGEHVDFLSTTFQAKINQAEDAAQRAQAALESVTSALMETMVLIQGSQFGVAPTRLAGSRFLEQLASNVEILSAIGDDKLTHEFLALTEAAATTKLQELVDEYTYRAGDWPEYLFEHIQLKPTTTKSLSIIREQLIAAQLPTNHVVKLIDRALGTINQQ